ncbi:MAG: T9SS type A sorting domain-containing protein [Bacteroidota bacterium]
MKDFAINGIKEKEVYIASLLSDKNTVEPQCRFILAPELILKNTGGELPSIKIDFDDRLGLRTVEQGKLVSVNYTREGEKKIRIVITDNNRVASISNSTINVALPEVNWGLYKQNVLRQQVKYADIPFKGYNESTGFNGLGWVTYLYRNSDWKLRKPVLVVDGFDPGNDRKDDTLFFNYLNNSKSIKFADLLYQNGYDLVILDLPKAFNQFANKVVDGGGDFIERNAMVAVKVIQEINSQLITNGSTEKLVVIGPSMGGLITRYTLAYMEQSGLNHNTRLWVSFDSPHNGANIPIGVQHFVNYFASISDDAEASRDEKLNCIAAKQMLLHHYLSDSENPMGATGFRNNFVSSLNSIGFPQNLRRVTVLNGSLNGTSSSATCSRAATMSIKGKFIWGWTEIGWGYINTTPSYGNRCLIFKGTKPSPFSSTTSKYAISLPNSYSLDNSPGGINNTFEQVSQNMVGLKNLGDNIFVYKTEWSTPIKSHSFIPTKSAFAFTGSNQDLAENLSGRNLVATGETPFQSYWGPKSYNMGHITFDPNMAIWLMGELNGLPQQPMAGSYQVVGPDAICTQTTANYSISGIPQLLGISWSCSGNLMLENAQGSSCSVRPSSSLTSDKGWVQATISLGNIAIGSYRKEVTVGAPSLPTICGIGEMTCGGTELFTECEHLSIQWSATYPLSITGGSYGYKCNVRAGNESGMGWVYATASNACGTKRAEILVEVSCGFYAIYPNPVYGEMIIETVETSNLNSIKGTSPEPIKSARVFNKMGLPVMTRNFSGKDKSVIVNISSLPKGVYLVKINETESHTIIKE